MFRMRSGRSLALATIIALTLSCDGDSNEPSRIEVEGQWTGGIQDGTGMTVATITLTLGETDGAVTGSGNFVTSTGSAAFALTTTGIYLPPNLSLTISALGFENVNLTATVGETSITGSLNGSAF